MKPPCIETDSPCTLIITVELSGASIFTFFRVSVVTSKTFRLLSVPVKSRDWSSIISAASESRLLDSSSISLWVSVKSIGVPLVTEPSTGLFSVTVDVPP
ncbi:hypothetical protein D3C74_386860 [compost metagenome]